MSEDPFLDEWRELRTVRGLAKLEALSVILLMRSGPLMLEDLEELAELRDAGRLTMEEEDALRIILKGAASSS